MKESKLKSDPVSYWKNCIQQEKKAHEKFRKQAEDSQKAALDEGNKSHTYNIHWSNCRVTASAIYAKTPKADVRRRYRKPDQEEKNLALAVERALDYSIDVGHFEQASRATVRDYVRSGLGVPRVVYEVKTAPQDMSPEALAVLEAMGEEQPEEIVHQQVDIEHVPWNCFGWEPGHSDWKNVNWVYFKTYTSSKRVKAEYGVDVAGHDEDKDQREARKYGTEVVLYEIWHKPSRMVFLICTNHDEPLEVRKDELGLQEFFPCARPMLDNLKSDELIPKPDYCFVQSQIEELQRIAQERKALAQKVRPIRVCDAKDAIKVQDIIDTPGGGIVPIVGMLEKLSESGGALIQPVPVDDLVRGLEILDAQLVNVERQVQDILGISDIVRGGGTNASETATAQQLKSNWANVRLNEKQSEVNRVWRESLRIMAEVICEHFTPEQIFLMTGVEITPRMMEMMHSDVGRNYAIDIETDSTVITDDQEERQQRLELVGVILDKLNNLVPAVQQGFVTPNFAMEILSFSASQYKNAKQLDDAIQELGPNLENLVQFQQQMAQMQQQLEQGAQQMQMLQQQNGQLQGQLAQFNERKESREDAKVQADIADKQARLQIDGMDKQTESGLDQARTDEIYHRMAQPTIVGIAP